jgi:hypothetical protein
VTNRSNRLRTPEQQVARRERKKHQKTRRAGMPAQMNHATNPRAAKKARQGEQAMHDQRKDET